MTGRYGLDYCQHAGVTASQPSTDITQNYIMNMGRADTRDEEQMVAQQMVAHVRAGG